MKMKLKLGLYIFLSALTMAVQASADSPDLCASEPVALLKGVHDKMLTVLEQDKQRLANDPEYLQGELKSLIYPYVDFQAMGRLMLGSHWKAATQKQQGQFIDTFRTMLVAIYGKSIALYNGQKLHFLPYQPGSRPNLAMVKSQVKQENGTGVSVDFRMRCKESDGWKIFDISVDGISLVNNYKATFQREISKFGLAGLLNNMSKKDHLIGQTEKE